MNTFMKSLIYTAILLLFLPSCVVIRAIRYGNASVDDYSVFEQEIVAKGSDPYHFTEKQNVLTLADTLKYEIYLSKTDTLLNVTLKEAMDYINVPSAAIVIQNDTVIFEHYSGGWDRKQPIMRILCNQDGHKPAVRNCPKRRVYQECERSGH